MKILAIEASTSAASVALSIDGVLLEKRCPAGLSSSETLLPSLQALLAEAGIGLAQCDAIAFGAGPGAFTGLRVAVGVTQGLAFAHDLPVLGIETLAAVAWASGAEHSLAALDARMNEIYSARYLRHEHGVTRQGEITVAAPAAVPLELAGSEWIVCGNAAAAYPLFAARLAAMNLTALPPTLPQAAAIAELAVFDYRAGRALAADLALPLYIRDKVALTVAERLATGGRA
jgi:tRNA threonylcarbamoyladenosine biosynthesis protein TsaB